MRISDWSSDVCSSDLWVHDLAEYLRKRASDRLPDGQRLEVTITDIARAGNYETWHGINADSIRFMRDVYPPRITLDFKLVGADGNVLTQGTRELSDIAYLRSEEPKYELKSLIRISTAFLV